MTQAQSPLLREFLDECLAYVEASDITRTGFGTQTVKDPNFIRALEDGRDLRVSTIERVRQWMADNPPKKAAAE